MASNCDNWHMNVTTPCVVSLTWTLGDALGETLDVLDQPVEFLVGGDDLLEAIETALQGHAIGAKLELNLEPQHAFGDYDENQVFLEPRAAFPAELEEGMTYEGQALPPGLSGTMPGDGFFTVTEIYPNHVVLDGNHPLAGIALRLKLKIEGVRAASDEEVERRSVGAGFFRVGPSGAAA